MKFIRLFIALYGGTALDSLVHFIFFTSHNNTKDFRKLFKTTA